MQTAQRINSQSGQRIPANRVAVNYLSEEHENGNAWRVNSPRKLATSQITWGDADWPFGKGEFFKALSTKARNDFCALATYFRCLGSTVLISEDQEPSCILLLLDGKVKISMNSSEGRRFLLGVAGPGDMLGLTSVVSGIRSEIRAETMYPCTIASLRRQDFLDFLLRHPVAWQNVWRELGLHYGQTCERLRMFGLTSSVRSRLAGFLLEWCRGRRRTDGGTQVWCVLTHEEIGECIGASRETVTRNLMDFKNHGLMELRGTTLIIPNRAALANYAGVEPSPDPNEPAA